MGVYMSYHSKENVQKNYEISIEKACKVCESHTNKHGKNSDLEELCCINTASTFSQYF